MTEKTENSTASVNISVVGEQDNGKIDIPEYAIERFAKFLLPKIRASLEAEKTKAS